MEKIYRVAELDGPGQQYETAKAVIKYFRGEEADVREHVRRKDDYLRHKKVRISPISIKDVRKTGEGVRNFYVSYDDGTGEHNCGYFRSRLEDLEAAFHHHENRKDFDYLPIEIKHISHAQMEREREKIRDAKAKLKRVETLLKPLERKQENLERILVKLGADDE
jgi:hypothetical protein